MTTQIKAGAFEVTHSSVLGLALPMSLAYLTTPFLGLVDTMVVGRTEQAALISGLGIGGIIIAIIFTTFNFLRSGTTGLTSQALGEGDEKEKQAILFRSLAIALIGGSILLLISPILLLIGLWAMEPSEDVSTAVRSYFLIRMISSPFTLGNYVILGWLVGLGRAGLGLALQLLLNGVNILFSLYLGLHLGLNIEGVAIATIIGEGIAFIVGLMICWKLLDHSIRPSKERVMQVAAWKRLFSLNGDIMIRSFCLIFAFGYFNAEGLKFGTVTHAANVLLMHFMLLSGYFLDGLATAAEQIVGRSVGAKYLKGFWRGFSLPLFWGVVMSLLCCVVYLTFGKELMYFLTTSEEIREQALIYMPWAIFIPLTGLLAFHMDGVYIGATWSRDMSIMMVFSVGLYLLIWSYVKEDYGNHGLWFSLHCFLVFRGIFLISKMPFNVRKTFAPQP